MKESNRKPRVQLIGTDGNAFSIIGKVSRALKDAGEPERARRFREEALASPSYDELLALTFKYVDVA
jgi:hypothetical protein